MLRNSLRYGAGLIALYLVVYNGSKSGNVIKEGAAGVSKITSTFQGR
jgi:hypothetical protein